MRLNAEDAPMLHTLCRTLGLRRPPALTLDAEGSEGAYHSDMQEIRIGEAKIRELPLNGRLGLLAHELGHHEITRCNLFKMKGWSAFFHILTNALEDCRVDTWMARRLSGAAPWYCSLYQSGNWDEQTSSKVPLSHMFALACKGEHVHQWKPFTRLDPSITKALDATRPARQHYCEILPPINRAASVDIDALPGAYQTKVIPTLCDPDAAALEGWEQMVQLSAREAFELAGQDIFPEALKLYDRDREMLNGLFQRVPKARPIAENVLETLSWREALMLYQVARNDFQKHPEPAKVKDGLQLADNLLSMYFANVEYRPPKSRSTGQNWEPQHRTYDMIAARLRPQTSQLIDAIQQVFSRQPPELSAGFRSGHALDVRKAMQFEANPANFEKLWQRWEPNKLEKAVFLLLIDLSGSMSGKKIHAAVDGAVLLIETLRELDTPMAVYGFQDVLIPFVEFDHPFEADSKARIEQMPLEVAGKRPGGNNQYGFNDDGPCLEEAANILCQRPETKKILIVISDGCPAGRHSNEGDLKSVIEHIQVNGRIFLFGIGIGPGTTHVRKFYPNHKAEVPVGRMAAEIGNLVLEQAVGNGLL